MLVPKSFSEGGIYSFSQKNCCFIKYLADVIESTQWHLRSNQRDINTDFETFISALRKHGEPLCVPSWLSVRYNEQSDYLVCTHIQIIGEFDVDCTNCPFCQDESWQFDPEILNGIKLIRDGVGRCKGNGINFIEHYISLFFPHLLQYMGNNIPEYCALLRKHYTSPKLFCEDIETEIGLQPMIGFFSESSREPLIMFYVALIKCQELLYFPIKDQMDDEGCSWHPHTGRELWNVAMNAVGLLVDIIRILPQIEEKYLGSKTDIDMKQILQFLQSQCTPSASVPADMNTNVAVPMSVRQGISLRRLAHCYCNSNTDLIGNRDRETTNLNERMRKLQKKYTAIGTGKYNAQLFTVADAVQLLQLALKNYHPISKEKATLLAQSVLEDVQKTS